MSAATAPELVALRRDLHQHPELGFAEVRTTGIIVDWLQALGLSPKVLPGGTGVLCDIGEAGPLIGLRADIDALPLPDLKEVDYRSQNDGVAHACGHDAHTTVLLGAAAELVERHRSDGLPGRVRLIFQPAEETIPGGALAVKDAGALTDVEQIFALHCDPRLDAGRIGVRVGAITAACDRLDVTLSGAGGHTSRPQLTADIVYSLGRLITDLPGLLGRRVDPRAALSLVWGAVRAGSAANAIPPIGSASATVRMLGRAEWEQAEPLIRELIEGIVAPTGAQAAVVYERGVPPVMNDAGCVAVQRRAIVKALGPFALATTEQSMGGEDFAWYLDNVPGALARLGVRPPGVGETVDLHRSNFDIDESALGVGVTYTAALAIAALDELNRAGEEGR
ncbi:amidohydrolase [Frankineae bacterium MT45]|nr:amidohydrolase [Frankineae bacterium MT45]